MSNKSDSLQRLADAVRGLRKDPSARWGDGPTIKFEEPKDEYRVPWWAWVMLAGLIGMAIHHYFTFPPL